MILPLKSILFSVITFCAIVVVGAPNATINIPLSKALTLTNRELYSELIPINSSSTIEVKFSNINKNISFIVFQVHSHLYNVTVYNNTLIQGSYVSGTNVGLYSSLDPKDNFFIFNPNEKDLTLLVSVYGYIKEDPIPGGCNLVFPIQVSPYMVTNWQKEVVLVDIAPAMLYKDQLCMMGTKLNVVFFIMYLPERDFAAETYFGAIKKMSTLEGIRENGRIVPNNKWPMRRTFSAYPGTGAIYAAVVSVNESPGYYSIYVPSSSYACSPLQVDTCELLDDFLMKLICASLIFVGVFVCYFGHRFFKTEMFLFGLLAGVVITYIMISLYTHLDPSVLICGSILSGVFFGAIWLTFWWYYGIPVIAVSLPAMNMGFLISSIIYNKYPGDIAIMQDDFNFWLVFILIMLLVTTALVSVAFISNILCCAVLGAYAIVYPMDFYLGSNVKYIIINTLRRAVVPKFYEAVLMTPFELRDGLIVAFWVTLAGTGFVFQHIHNRGRPPFPPPPRSVRPGMPEPTGYGSVSTRSLLTPSAGLPRPATARVDEKTPLLSEGPL